MNIELREIPEPTKILSTEEIYGVLAKANNDIVEIISKNHIVAVKEFKIQANVLGGMELAAPALIESFKDKGWILDISKIEKEVRIKWENNAQIAFHGEIAYCSLEPVSNLPGKVESNSKGKRNIAHFAKIMGLAVLAYGVGVSIFVGYIGYLHAVGTCQAPQVSLDQLKRDVEP